MQLSILPLIPSSQVPSGCLHRMSCGCRDSNLRRPWWISAAMWTSFGHGSQQSIGSIFPHLDAIPTNTLADYAIDEQTTLKVVNGVVEVVSQACL